MRRALLSTAGIAALLGAIWLPVGCSVGIGGSGFDFLKMMTCPNDPIESEGDLVFTDLQFNIPTLMPMPGDHVNFTYTVSNQAATGTENANIGMPSNMKLFLSFDNRISPDSYLFGDIPISGINAGDSASDITTLTLPRPSAEPDTGDVDIGTGNLSGETLTTAQDTSDYLDRHDWVLIRGPAPDNNEAFFRITEVLTTGSEYEVEGLHPDGANLNNVQLFMTHRPKYFPYLVPEVSPDGDIAGIRDPNSPNYIGPERVRYNVIVVLDAQNCILEAVSEADDDYDPTVPEYERYLEDDLSDGAGVWGATYNTDVLRLNNQAIAVTLDLLNPNLPNLQISFVDRSPTTDIPQTGGVVDTRWEITNDGISPVTIPFLVRVYFSENESYNIWDETVSEANWPALPGGLDPPRGEIDEVPPLHPWQHIYYEVPEELVVPGNSNVYEVIRVNFPYYTWRFNTYQQDDESALYSWVAGSPSMFRRRGPTDPPSGWWFAVYLPIPTIGGASNYLIAEVDVEDLWYENFIEGTTPGPLPPEENHSNRVRQSNQYDTFSHQIQNGNGNIEVGFENELFPLDTAAVDLVVSPPPGGQGGGYFFDLIYDNEHPGGDYSIGFYLSDDDTMQAANWFWNRFWWTLNTGQGNQRDEFYGVIADVPRTGTWHVGAVVDDIFRYPKRYNDNNHVMSNSTITIQ